MNNQIKICPKCGSIDISFYNYEGISRDVCKNCGFQGIFPEINKTEIKEFKNKLELD